MGFSSVTSMVSDVLVLSPVALLIAATLSLVRFRRSRKWQQAVLDSTFDTLTLGVLALISIITLVNPGSSGGVEPIPFTDLAASGWSPTRLYQYGGNIAMFVPLGALLPLALRRRLAGFPRVLAAAGTVSVIVEILQYALGVGRVTSVEDIILNCAGALTGAALTWPWWRARACRHGSGAWAPPGNSAISDRV